MVRAYRVVLDHMQRGDNGEKTDYAARLPDFASHGRSTT
jgi:hypothetical protein